MDYEKRTDEEIVKQIRTGDVELYAVIMERYVAKLKRYVSAILGEGSNADDIVQDSFIKVFVNLNGFNLKKKFSSWIYRIVHNEAINAVKRTHRLVSLPEGFDVEDEENIEEELDKREIVERVSRCLKEMPLLYSEPLALHFIADKSYEEISDILRIPNGTVATRIHRAKNIMRKICQKN